MGCSVSQYKLGPYYGKLCSDDSEDDASEMFKWYLESAKQGNKDAIQRLIVLIEEEHNMLDNPEDQFQ